MLTRGAKRANAANAQATAIATATTTNDNGTTTRADSEVVEGSRRSQPTRTVKAKGVQKTHLQLAGTSRKGATRSKQTKKVVKAPPAAKKAKKARSETPAQTAAKAENSSNNKDESAESTPAPIQSKDGQGAATGDSDKPSTSNGADTRVATDSSSGETLVEESQTPKVKATKSKVAIEDFEWARDLGQGGTAKVYLCRRKGSKQHFALKAIQKNTIRSNASRARIMNERKLLKHLAVGNPFVVKLHGSFQNKTHLFLALDYHSGGDLITAWNVLGGLDAKLARFWMMEMVAGLSSIHKCGIVHRDMKPENVLIDCDGHIVITDFGMAKQLQEHTSDAEQTEYETTNSYCGTDLYMSPEIIQRLQYSFSTDWWSLGTIMYEMLLAVLPFCTEEEKKSENINKMFDRIVNEDLQFPELPEISTAEEDLLRKLLNKDHEARISENGIKRHRYFAHIQWKKVDRKGYTPPYIPDPSKQSHAGDEYVCMGAVLKSEKGKQGRGCGDSERNVSKAI